MIRKNHIFANNNSLLQKKDPPFSYSGVLAQLARLSRNYSRKVSIFELILSLDLQKLHSLLSENIQVLHLANFSSNQVEYYHNVTYDISSLTSGDEMFIKIYVKDDVNEVTEIPNNGDLYEKVKHFTFEIL